MSDVSLTAQTGHEPGGHVEHYDPFGGKMGFWLFLFTEVFLFGMFFLAFSIYLQKYRVEFQTSSEHLDVAMGGTNTAILLTDWVGICGLYPVRQYHSEDLAAVRGSQVREYCGSSSRHADLRLD